MKFIPETSHAH